MQTDDIKAYAKEVADKLGETNDYPRRQIELLIEHAGREFVAKKLEETEKVEAEGGMKTESGKRRRTKGGVFFYLAKGDMKWKVRNMIFPNFGQKNHGRVLEWHEREDHITPLLDEDKAGSAQQIDITLTGRPGEVNILNENSVVTTIRHDYRLTLLPRGVPQPMQPTSTLYTVYMDHDDWQKVNDTLSEDDEALLTVTGPCLYDTATGSIAVLGREVALYTEDDDTSSESSSEDEAAQTTKADTKTESAPATTDDTAESDDDKAARYGIPEDVPDDTREELLRLYGGAEALRERITTMEKQNKPGVNMTKRLLKNTEKKIERLMKPYS